MKSGGRRSTTNELDFFEQLQARSPEAADVARRILDWSREHFSFVDWEASSFVPKLDYGAGSTHNPITVYGLGKFPRVGVKFIRMKNRNGFSETKRLELMRRLNAIPGVKLKPDAIDGHQRST